MEGMKFYLTWEESEEDGMTLLKKISNYIEENEIYEFENLNIGNWEESYENAPEEVIKYIADHKSKFPNLKKIHLGDIESEECEISWITHTDASALVNNFNLEEFKITGANELRLSNISSESLKKLTIISGGLSSDILKDIADAKLPNLEYLELYLGVDDYGFDGDISDVEPLMQREKFPNLKYLGLKNSEIEDTICKKVLEADIVKDLEVLDLSLGTLSDKGASVILENVEKLTHLKKLDLTYNYISEELADKITQTFNKLEVEVLIDRDDAEAYEDEDEEWRFPYITE